MTKGQSDVRNALRRGGGWDHVSRDRRDGCVRDRERLGLTMSDCETQKAMPEIERCPNCECATYRRVVFERIAPESRDLALDTWQVECMVCGMRGPRSHIKLHAILDWNNISKSCA